MVNRLLVVCVCFLCVTHGQAQETSAKAKPYVVVSIACLSWSGNKPIHLSPVTKLSADRMKVLSRLWEQPSKVLEELQQETPGVVVALKFLGSMSIPSDQTGELRTGMDLPVGDEYRSIGTRISLRPAVKETQIALDGKYEDVEVTPDTHVRSPDGKHLPLFHTQSGTINVLVANGELVIVGSLGSKSVVKDITPYVREKESYVSNVWLVRVDILK